MLFLGKYWPVRFAGGDFDLLEHPSQIIFILCRMTQSLCQVMVQRRPCRMKSKIILSCVFRIQSSFIKLSYDQGDENNDSTSSSEDILSLVKTIFQRQGHLEKQMDFEHRPEQEKMAIAVHESIEDEAPTCQAGTGVGRV